jgi:hypothetical protein
LDKGSSLLDPKEGQKKHGEIMVNPLQASLIKATRGAHPGLVIQGYRLGLYSTDKEKHGAAKINIIA